MEALGETTAAAFEATVFLDYFKDMPDPRQPGKVAYRLGEAREASNMSPTRASDRGTASEKRNPS